MTVPLPDSFLAVVHQHVRQTPHKIAIEELGEQAWTYQELWLQAHGYATATNGYEDLIALDLKRGFHFVAALLGCWLSGKAALILDPAWPDDRKKRICQEAPAALIFQRPNPTATEAAPPQTFQAHDPAYVIHSSGSSGKPKGVIVPHERLLSLFLNQCRALKISPESRFLWLNNVAFDPSIADIGVALTAGATLCYDSAPPSQDPSTFLKRIGNFQITHIDIPPSLLALLDVNQAPNCLESLLIGGEVCAASTIAAWSHKVNLINVYGPTEATICTSLNTCQSNWQEGSIGIPVEGVNYHLVSSSEHQKNQGELHISGLGLAIGYLNQPELTSTRFFTEGGTRYYRTGDLVERLPHGEYIFRGRCDRQFKKNGYLICPEEIEKRLLAHPQISNAHLALIEGHLQAWYESPQEIPDLEQFLTSKLPHWMAPTHWHPRLSFPKTNNQKIDRRALEQRTLTHQKNTTSCDSLVERIRHTMANTLGQPEFSANDSFYSYGADSLSTLRLLLACDQQGIPLSAELLSSEKTPSDIAARLEGFHLGLSTQQLTTAAQAACEELQLSSHNQSAPGEDIFLTGTTGNLGSVLLPALLSQTSGRIYCLYRNLSKFDELIKSVSLKDFSTEQLSQRLLPLVGDLSRDHLGLHLPKWDEISQRCGTIIHLAADIHSLRTFQELAPQNLQGTRRILQLLAQGTPKRLLYASTLSVFVDSDPLPAVCLEQDDLTREVTIFGGYAQSKFAAEKLVRLTQQQNPELDIQILRYGLLTPSQTTGLANSDDPLLQLLQAQPPTKSKDALGIDITPLDYAVHATLKILKEATTSATWHIANPQALSQSNFYHARANSSFHCAPSEKYLEPSHPHSPLRCFKTNQTRFDTAGLTSLGMKPPHSLSHSALVSYFNLIYQNNSHV